MAIEESAEDLYEHAPCGYLSTAPDGTIVRVNATFERWTGHRREALVGLRRFQDLLTAGGRIYHETHYAPLLRMQGTAREIAVEVVCASGDRLPVLLNSVLLRDAEGEPRVVRTTLFDARERKSYERELLAARNRERAARTRTERLQRITAAIAAAPDARGIGAAVLAELVAAYGAERAGIAVVDPVTGELEVIAQHGPPLPEEAAAPGAVRLAVGAPPGLQGRLWLSLPEGRPVDDDELGFLRACAAQTGLALERSRLYEETLDVAHSLQQSMLAGDPPRDPRFEVAALYRPAVEHLEVGGDWHDAFELPGGHVGIVVGDVVGRGLAAASAMGQLRSALRALAGAGLRPAVVLEHLDTFVGQVEAARDATVGYAEVDPGSGRVAYASAGHLPPFLLAPGDEPRAFLEGLSPPLGLPMEGERRTEAEFTLAPGGGFLLYTDGLVERRTEAIDAGLERLAATIREHPGAAPAELVEVLPAALLEPDSGGDDVCLLAFRLTPP